MGIRVKHDADAEVIGRLALATGQGAYNKWLYEQQQQERMQQASILAQAERQREALKAQQDRDYFNAYGAMPGEAAPPMRERERRRLERRGELPPENTGPLLTLDQKKELRARDEWDRRQAIEEDQWANRKDVEQDMWLDRQDNWADENDRRAERDQNYRLERDGANAAERMRRDQEKQLDDDIANGAYTPDQIQRIQRIRMAMSEARRDSSLDDEEREFTMNELNSRLSTEVANRVPRPKQSESPTFHKDDQGREWIKTPAGGWEQVKAERVKDEKPEVSHSEFMRMRREAREALSAADPDNPPTEEQIDAEVDRAVDGYRKRFGRIEERSHLPPGWKPPAADEAALTIRPGTPEAQAMQADPLPILKQAVSHPQAVQDIEAFVLELMKNGITDKAEIARRIAEATAR